MAEVCAQRQGYFGVWHNGHGSALKPWGPEFESLLPHLLCDLDLVA